MEKTSQYRKYIALIALVACAFGCSSARFEGTTASSSILGVCNPFGGSDKPGQGLFSDGVKYVEVSQLPASLDPLTVVNNSVEGFYDSSNPYASYIGSNPSPIILGSIDFPAMYFSQGFVNGGGQALKDNSGATLIQYFSLRLNSNFVPATWAPGLYQIATITDDGSILTMTGGQADGTDFVISNDGGHSMRMGCGTNPLNITSTSNIPLQLDYFQGPPITIGLMMLYRPVSIAGNAVDPLCGQGGSDDSYFFLDHDSNNNPLSPSQAQAPYLQLTAPFNPATGSGGWQVVEDAHFELPPGTNFSCPK